MFKELAKSIQAIKVNQEITFTLNDNKTNDESRDTLIVMGVKCIEEFDSKLLILGAYGGGFNSIMWFEEKTINEIEEYLNNEFDGIKFKGFGDMN
jgi:hypothetical protein